MAYMTGLDNAMWISADAGEVLLLGILAYRRLIRNFPIFAVYIAWQVVSDIILVGLLHENHGASGPHFIHAYYSLSVPADVLELGVLLEIAANVLRPARKALTSRPLLYLLCLIIIVGFMSYLGAEKIGDVITKHPSIFVIIDTSDAILRLAVFIAIAGFSQILGISWRNHVLQLATGLGFYAIIVLIGQVSKSQLHAGPMYSIYYHRWSEFDVAGYLCTLYFWCWAFWKKEDPRRDFSPKMAKFLASLSGSAKRQNAVLARSRNE